MFTHLTIANWKPARTNCHLWRNTNRGETHIVLGMQTTRYMFLSATLEASMLQRTDALHFYEAAAAIFPGDKHGLAIDPVGEFLF